MTMCVLRYKETPGRCVVVNLLTVYNHNENQPVNMVHCPHFPNSVTGKQGSPPLA